MNSWRQLHRRIRRLRTNQSGLFTVEATLIYPLVFVLMAFLLFMLLFAYQKTDMYYRSSVAAVQTAHAWNNSGIDLETGQVPSGHSDGLYWRLTDDALLTLLGIGSAKEAATVDFQVDPNTSYTGLPAQKLLKAVRGGMLSGEGEVAFRHRGYERQVLVSTTQDWVFSDNPYFASPSTASIQVQAAISEPVEFLRTMDLIMAYAKRWKERGTTANGAATNAIRQYEYLRESEVIDSHDGGAEPYLRRLVDGQETWITVEHDGKTARRKIDALDERGIAHQAFYTTNYSNLRNVQLPKDQYLLENGLVKGVIWHFFRVQGQKKVGPSQAIKDALKKEGIVVVLHD